MLSRPIKKAPCLHAIAAAIFLSFAVMATGQSASSYWLDMFSGEQVDDVTLLDDLATAKIIYAGEVHTIPRHHETQVQIFEALAKRDIPLALGLEQLEAVDQPAVDRFNRKELTFFALAEEIGWAKKWKNYEQYRPLCESAQKRGIPVIALNAPASVIKAVGREGLGALTPELRSQLPLDMATEDPVYEKLMNLLLAVHMSMDPAKLRTVFEAQVARDETMAVNVLKAANADGKSRTVFVVCGRGHISYGLGLPDRVRRRIPEARQRILLVTESGELKLSPAEQAMARSIRIQHEDLRGLQRPLADYLQVLPRPAAKEEEP